MAAGAIAYTTAGTTLNKVYRKIQGGMLRVFNSKCEEWQLIDDVDDLDIDHSAREMTIPIDVNPSYGVAMIPEAGREAIPTTPNLDEITVGWVNLNKRFSASLTAKYLDKKAAEGQVIRQFRHQTLKVMEAISNRVGQQFYGFSTGVVAKSSTNATATTQTLTLKDAYGDSALDDTAYLSSFFEVGDNVALVRSGSLVSNAIGEITSKATLGEIVVVFQGSVDADDGDSIVFANNAHTSGSTLADNTDYNKWPVGLKDMAESASVHGCSNTTAANWDAALVNTAGGRYSVIKDRKGRQALANKGDGKADIRIMSNGVQNDIVDSQLAALRFSTAQNMEFDGSFKTKGTKDFTSRKVPNGHVFQIDKDALAKFSLLPKPTEGGQTWADGDKAEDFNALKFSVDWPYGLVCKSRRKIVEYRGLTEQ